MKFEELLEIAIEVTEGLLLVAVVAICISAVAASVYLAFSL